MTLGVFVSMTSVLKCGSVYTVLWVYVRDTTIYVGIFIAFKCIFFSSSIGLPLEGN